MKMKCEYNSVELGMEAIKECVGKGWHKLLDELVSDLEKLGWDGVVAQVKEKFGGLRFYIGSATDAIFDRIDEAEHASMKICEKCGAPGSPRYDHYWIKTLCEACRLERDKEHEAKEANRETSSTSPSVANDANEPRSKSD